MNMEISWNDTEVLIHAMQTFSEILENCGIEGSADVKYYSNGNIQGTFWVNGSTPLRVTIEDDGKRKMVEYV